MGISILYIKKRPSTKSWSDVLQKQYHYLKANANASLIEIDTSGPLSYLNTIHKIIRFFSKNKVDLIYVNHVICAYPIIAALFLSGMWTKVGKRVLALHETEPVLGAEFLRKNRKNLSWKERIRYTRFMKFPLRFFDLILVLSNRQIGDNSSGSFRQLNFLGIDINHFRPNADPQKAATIVIFFPHNRSRPEKRYNLAYEACSKLGDDYKLITGGNIPHEQMPTIYESAHIALLTGHYETYSLVLLEAMAMNRYIVATHEIGLVENLLGAYSKEDLFQFGLAVVQPSVNDVYEGLTKCISRIQLGIPPSTKTLLLKENLHAEGANRNLLTLLSKQIEHQ